MICYSWFDGLLVSSRRWYGKDSVFLAPSLIQCLQVSIERVKEYSELEREPPEFVEPRPPESWPTTGRIECKDLVIRYSVCFHCQISLTGVAADELFSARVAKRASQSYVRNKPRRKGEQTRHL